jgi:hypothetical protein
MKKWPALALTAGLLTTGLTTTEATAGDPAPTNVHVTWKDETFTHVRVTWEEDEPRPNKIVLRHKGTTGSYRPVYVAADAPNVVDFAASNVQYYAWVDSTDPLEFAVSVGTNAGETSPVAASEAFDAFTPDRAALVSTTMSGSSTLTVKWAAPPKSTDKTPNDPLDRNIPLTYAPYYSLTQGGTRVPIGGKTSATQVKFTGPKPAFRFGVVAHNEWGGQFDGAWVAAEPSNATAKLPAWTVYLHSASKITGTYTPADQRRQVVLQARNNSTSPWYVVGSHTFSGGTYGFDLSRAGTRQYRVAIPNTVYYDGGLAVFGGYSATVKTTTQLNTLGFFQYDQIYAGWSNKTVVQVNPLVNTTATLQRWNGKTWSAVGPVKVKSGTGNGYIRATKPGRTAYRYYVPATMHGGLYYAASYTNTFVNDVM